jgi:hypothetical protein
MNSFRTPGPQNVGGAGVAFSGVGGSALGGQAASGAQSQVKAMDVVNRLLAMGVDPNHELTRMRPNGPGRGRFADYMLRGGTGPLMIATLSHDNEAMKALLAHNAEVDVPNAFRITPLMAAAGLSAVLMERWQGFVDPGLLGPDPLEERRRGQLASLPVADAFEPEAPLVVPATMLAADALRQLIAAHGHCLLMSEGAQVVGLVTLADLQATLTAAPPLQRPCVRDCLRSDLVWLPVAARLDRLEDQIKTRGHRQVPVFAVVDPSGTYLPEGPPNGGLPVGALRGMASRDGLSRALARGLQSSESEPGLISASATGSA